MSHGALWNSSPLFPRERPCMAASDATDGIRRTIEREQKNAEALPSAWFARRDNVHRVAQDAPRGMVKDYLAGNAPEDWVPLRPDSFYSENAHLRLNATVNGVDPRLHEVAARGREQNSLWPTAMAAVAEPVRPSIPGADQRQVCSLRVKSRPTMAPPPVSIKRLASFKNNVLLWIGASRPTATPIGRMIP